MLGRPRLGTDQRALDEALFALGKLFADAEMIPIAPPHLYLAETLLSLYGEDLRARAFLFPDAERGNELCLRPDFTVPVALAHGAGGWDRNATYAYQGPVFRRQQPGLSRPVEYIQAGLERFGDSDTPAADAGVLGILLRGLEMIGVGEVAITIGDLSVPFALLDALEMPEHRREALRRHFWRPARFQDLLRRAVAPPAPSPARRALLDAARTEGGNKTLRMLLLDAGEMLGARSSGEILERVTSLSTTASDPPMPERDACLIDAILEIEAPAPEALRQLQRLAREADIEIDDALDRFSARLDALEDEGIDASRLSFDASFGRNLEYYDGFVFEVRAMGRAVHPPLAGGGRYDTMTVRLGAATAVPAVGGMIRVEAALGAGSYVPRPAP